MIEKWIESFRNAWLGKDVQAAVSLFAEDVEYWETPFQKVALADLAETWNAILTQENINLKIEPIMSDELHHTLRWELSYNKGDNNFQWAGVYIVQLNSDGKSNYFYQVGEQA